MLLLGASYSITKCPACIAADRWMLLQFCRLISNLDFNVSDEDIKVSSGLWPVPHHCQQPCLNCRTPARRLIRDSHASTCTACLASARYVSSGLRWIEQMPAQVHEYPCLLYSLKCTVCRSVVLTCLVFPMLPRSCLATSGSCGSRASIMTRGEQQGAHAGRRRGAGLCTATATPAWASGLATTSPCS